MKRAVIIILIVIFAGLVVAFGLRQGLHKLSLGRIFTAEFQDKQREKQALKPQPSGGDSHNGTVDKQKPSEKRGSKESKQIEKQLANGSRQMKSAPGQVQQTQQSQLPRSPQKETTQLEYDSIKCRYTSMPVPDLFSRLREVTVEVRGWRLESVEKLKTGYRYWEPIENAEVEVSVMDGIIVSTDTQNTKGKTDATGRFVTYWRTGPGKASYLDGVFVYVTVPGWNDFIFCSDLPSIGYWQ